MFSPGPHVSCLKRLINDKITQPGLLPQTPHTFYIYKQHPISKARRYPKFSKQTVWTAFTQSHVHSSPSSLITKPFPFGILHWSVELDFTWSGYQGIISTHNSLQLHHLLGLKLWKGKDYWGTNIPSGIQFHLEHSCGHDLSEVLFFAITPRRDSSLKETQY